MVERFKAWEQARDRKERAQWGRQGVLFSLASDLPNVSPKWTATELPSWLPPATAVERWRRSALVATSFDRFPLERCRALLYGLVARRRDDLDLPPGPASGGGAMEGRLMTGRPDSAVGRLEWHEPREGWRRGEPPAAPELAARKPSYVVVDEIVGDAVGVRSTRGRWPTTRAGCGSRTTARGGSPGRASRRSRRGVDDHRVAALAAASSPAAEALATRPLAIGDVFAATTHAEGAGVTPETLLGTDFVDLTIDAREAAKLAFYGAVDPPLAEDEAPRWIDVHEEDDEPPTATGTPVPVPRVLALPEPVPAHLFASPAGSSMRGTTRTSSFAVNVGDGDTQLLVLPVRAGERRRCIVVDVASARKRRPRARSSTGRLGLHPELFAIVVATHAPGPLSAGWRGSSTRSSTRSTSSGARLLSPERRIQGDDARAGGQRNSPHAASAGMTRFLSGVKATVLSPGVSLRHRFDSYGIEINNASISLKLDFPAVRVVEEGENRRLRKPSPQSLVLGSGADALGRRCSSTSRSWARTGHL